MMEQDKPMRYSLDGLNAIDELVGAMASDLRTNAADRARADGRAVVLGRDVTAATRIVMAQIAKELAPEPKTPEPKAPEPKAPPSSEPILSADQAAEVAYEAADVLARKRGWRSLGNAAVVSPFELDRIARDLKALGRWAEGRARAEAGAERAVGAEPPKRPAGLMCAACEPITVTVTIDRSGHVAARWMDVGTR